uniref:TPT domain-containing protein n=1 Tax=Caenorhabditis tropicalis TaxID=1561998 RepID=A0A1I7USS6_9PELO
MLPAAGAKLLEVLIASLANSHNRTGELFLVRTFDFLFAGAVLFYFSSRQTGKGLSKTDCWLIAPLAIAASISWLEPGQMEYTGVSLISAFLLPFSRATSFILLKNSMECLGKGHINAFMLEYTRFVSILLFLPALVSYSLSSVEVTASWESIDMVLMSLSFLFMICNLYSNLWLTLSLGPGTYLVLENSRNLLASCAQWIIQNMAHPSLIAFGAKLVAFSSIFRIWTRS